MSGDVLPAGSQVAPEVGDELRLLVVETRAALAAASGDELVAVPLRHCVHDIDCYLKQQSISTSEATILVSLFEAAIESARNHGAMELAGLIDRPRGRITSLRYSALEARLRF